MEALALVHSLKSRLTLAAVSALLLLGAGCSNPLSSSGNDHLQNFHSKNVNCDELNFSMNTVSVDQIRSLTHCLNAHQELDAFETLLDSVSDADLQPVSDLVNDMVNTQPKLLYALRDAYNRAKQTGDLKAVETTVAKLFANAPRNAAAVKVLQKVSAPLINTVFDSKLSPSLSSVYVLSRSKSFNRLGAEYLATDGLKTILQATVHYLHTPGAKSVRALYGYIADNSLDTRWTANLARNEQTRVQNLSHFFEWLFSNGRYEILSTGIRHAISEPVKCFDGTKEVPNPLTVVQAKIATMNTQDAIHYFTHDVKNLYLTSQGYCEFPYQFSALIELVDESTKIAGFDEVYTIAQPLLSNPDFLAFVGGEASSQFVKELSPLVSKHFFEDLFTLITLHLQNPLTNDGAKVATLIDDLLKPLNDNDVKAVVDFISPIMTASESYGAKITRSAYQMAYGFPSISFEIKPAIRSALITSVQNIVQRSEIASVMDLGSSLITQGKLDGILDQSLVYLQSLFDRGRFPIDIPRIKDPATITLASVQYLVEKMSDPVATHTVCDDLSYNWIFSNYSSSSSAAYLQQIDAIQTCVNPNQTFTAAKELIKYSISKSSYNFLLKTQKVVINSLFKTNTDLFLGTVDDFLSVGQSDSDNMRKLLNLGSLSMGLIKDNLLAKSALRKTVADFVKDPLSYQAVAELTGPKPRRTRSSAPTLDLVNLTKVNAIVTKDRKLNQVPVEDAVKAIILEYCPSLNTAQADCDIDADQIALYRQSPKLLFQQIAREELESSQSWLHPNLSDGWIHENGHPSQVSSFEFHLNPALHLFRKSPQAPQALLNALARVKKDQMSLPSFLKDRATRVVLIPYIYQVPNFPSGSTKEYHDRIRIRILNDLDRLELIAINADFKAFNLVSNIGMGMIRDIGLAWGDVAPANRPSTLEHILGRNTQPKTLKTVKESIESQMSTFDVGILQSLGNCDPRGRNALGRWLVARTCNAELFDVSARMFNLRFLISLLQDELPAADGGHGGLEFLRDFFYALYESNTDASRDNFANGVSLNDVCLDNPLNSAQPNRNCQKDLLTLISRVTHLGLLHQAGVSVLQAKDHPIDAVSSVIDRVTDNAPLSQLFVNSLSSDAGIQFLKDAVDYGFQSPEGTGKNLSLLTQMMTIPKDLTWVNLAFEMIPKAPHFPIENKALINAVLSIDAEDLKPWVDHWISDPSLPTPKLLNLVSQKLTPATRADALNLLVELTPNSGTFAQYFTTAKNLPAMQNTTLKKDANLWASQFASNASFNTRTALADWTLSPDFKQFCDVFSDSAWTTKAYNFLESVNQNNDSNEFLKSCRDFLNLH